MRLGRDRPGRWERLDRRAVASRRVQEREPPLASRSDRGRPKGPGIGEKPAFGVAFDRKTSTAWVACLGSDLLRFTSDDRELSPLPIQARSIAVSPTTGQVWAATETELVRMGNDGRIEARSPLERPSRQSWLAAF